MPRTISLSLRQTQCLAGYLARSLVAHAFDELGVQWRWSLAVHEVGGLDAEDGRQARHLSHRGVGYPPGPYPLDLLLREVSRAHAGHFGVRVRLPRLRVPDGPE